MISVYRNDPQGERIIGRGLPAFYFNANVYYQTFVNVYRDGMIGYASLHLVELDEFRKIIEQRVITTEVPDGAPIVCSGIYSFTAREPNCVNATEFLKHIEDTLRELRGEPTTTRICVDLFRSFIEDPSVSNREKLQAAYLKVPAHRRKFILGDMDFKDTPIRAVLYEGRRDTEYLEMLRERYGNSRSD